MAGALQASLVFDGTNEYVDVGDVLSMRFQHNDAFSFVMWFRTCSSGNEAIITKRLNSGSFRGYVVFTNGGAIGLQLVNQTGSNLMQVETIASTIADGQWHQVIVTWDGSVSQDASNTTVYIDGVSEALSVANNSLSATIEGGGLFQMGALAGVSSFFDGNLAGAVVYDIELTAGDVTTLYNGGTPVDHTTVGPTADLVELWLLGTGDVFDTATALNGDDGTMTNMEAGDIVTDSPGAASTTPPVIDNFDPPVGTPINRDDVIRFDIIDLSGLLRAEITVKLSNEDDRIVVHDGDQFCGRFTNLSSRTPIANGFAYALKPNGGWKGSPDFKVHAVDTAGNEAI